MPHSFNLLNVSTTIDKRRLNEKALSTRYKTHSHFRLGRLPIRWSSKSA